MASITTIQGTDSLRDSRAVINTNFTNINNELVTISGLGGIPGPTGPAGPTGPMGTGIVWRGTWNNGTSYIVNDAVTYDGSSYVAILANTATTPGTDPTRWQVFAAKGDPSTPPFATQSVYLTSTSTHTTDNTWEDISGMSVTFIPSVTTNVLVLVTMTVTPTSGNWEFIHSRLVIDGTPTDRLAAILSKRNTMMVVRP
jgi:hypothetical protein